MKLRWILVAGGLAAACFVASACGDSDVEQIAAPAPAVNYATATADLPPAPRAEARQSSEERRVGSLTIRLQRLVVEEEYAAVCALLSAAAVRQASAGGSCPAGVETAVRKAPGRLPTFAWVRLRGTWGSVIIREQPADSLAITLVVQEGGKWRFPTLETVGVDWP